jgi:hypothetical protein
MNFTITITPVLGGFIVSYPKMNVVHADDSYGHEYVQEVATTVGRAMRIAKLAVDEFSLVTKAKTDE